MKFKGQTYSGSGTLVSPCHVLTAGHNLYDHQSQTWAEEIEFYPAKSETNNPKSIKCIKKTVFFNWQYGNPDSDMGLLLLEEPIGVKIGWNGMLYLKDDYLTDRKSTLLNSSN